MGMKINGGMPNASRGLSLKKSLPVIRERCKHEVRHFGIVSNPRQRGIHLYSVLLVRLTSHVYTTEDLTDLVNEVITAIFEICR